MNWDETRLLLARRRRHLRMTQDDVAMRLRTQQSHISDLEGGGSLPNIDTLLRWLKVLDLELKVVEGRGWRVE
jgi:transcriptional regulator with XRE-family HTH domain